MAKQPSFNMLYRYLNKNTSYPVPLNHDFNVKGLFQATPSFVERKVMWIISAGALMRRGNQLPIPLDTTN